MRNKMIVAAVAFVGLALATSALVPAAEPVRQGQQLWEYKVLDDTSENEQAFNQLGTNAWELVSIRTKSNGLAVVVFKRPR